jgi:hypothetical protein
MWDYFLANYSRLGFILLGVLLLSKLLLAVLFQNYERSVVGVVSAIFRWYGVPDRDLAENNAERLAMRLQNFISIIFYIVAAALLFTTILFT